MRHDAPVHPPGMTPDAHETLMRAYQRAKPGSPVADALVRAMREPWRDNALGQPNRAEVRD